MMSVTSQRFFRHGPELVVIISLEFLDGIRLAPNFVGDFLGFKTCMLFLFRQLLWEMTKTDTLKLHYNTD